MVFTQMLANVAETWQDKIVAAVDNIMVPLLIIACSVGMIWAIVIGIKMMKADDKNAREENKAKLINIAISIVAVAVLIGLFYALKNWLGGYKDKDLGSEFGDLFSSNVGSPLLNTFNLVKQCASMVIFKC